MTDEARIERLTELAQRVWPDRPLEVRCAEERIVEGSAWEVVEESPDGDEEVCYLRVLHEGHELDALEAALSVLSGKDEPLSTSQAKDVWSEGFEAAKALFAQPAWVDQLASEWEARAEECAQKALEAHARDDCELVSVFSAQEQAAIRYAAELRERAKGAT